MRAFPFKPGYRLFAFSVFLSAFLLFAIQPVASKHLLPYFGGSSSVWATSLSFFTSILFLGYSYVCVLTALPARRQMIVHGCAIGLAMLSTAAALVLWGSLYPPLQWIEASTQPPALRVLIALSISVGVPYFLLSSTGPLLQYWYGAGARKEPYKLYALSNAGSLLALLAYPVLIEPRMPLMRQEWMWCVLFLLYALLLAAITSSDSAAVPARAPLAMLASKRRSLAWIGLAALPAFLLVATTTVITQLIAPVPLLWVIPLCLYLLTFIIAFSGRASSRWISPVLLLACAGAYQYVPASPAQMIPELCTYLAFFFFACLFCHGQLYRLRPPTETLPFFYLCTSLGGAIGTMLASFAAPFVFSNFYEFPLGLALAASLAAVSAAFLWRPVSRIAALPLRAAACIAPLACAVLFAQTLERGNIVTQIPSRDFYGAVIVWSDPETDATILMNGTTLHGMQSRDPQWSYVPTTYYTQSSGLGRAVEYARDAAGDGPIKVGIVGLGTGTIAAYCRTGDTFTFYEIDPKIERIARTYFSYLSRCAGGSVVIGDGRIMLENAAATTTYDMIALDAFTDDAIPTHLMTKEAIALYMKKLSSPRGVLAMHTSNRFLALAPVLLSNARSLGLTAMIVNDSGAGNYLPSASQWVLLSKDPKIFNDKAFIGVAPWRAPHPLPPPWTDQYTSLFSVFVL